MIPATTGSTIVVDGDVAMMNEDPEGNGAGR